MIIGQKYAIFPSLKELPLKGDNVEAPDLFTIERRISYLGDYYGPYGPKEILQDLSELKGYIQSLYEEKGWKKGRKYYMLLRSATEVYKMVKKELDKFENCSDCVAHYYNSDDYFTVPCEKLHSIVCVKRAGARWPAKTIEVRNGKVLVAYFGSSGKSNFVHHQEWVAFEHCVMASTCFGYEIVNRSHKQAIMEMGTYIQMMARKLQRYYTGFPCHGCFGRHEVVFQPEYLTISDDRLSANPPGNYCACCNTPILKSVTIKLPKRKRHNVLKKPKVRRVKYPKLCDRTGCPNMASQQCFFCTDGVFCSSLCSHMGFQEHRMVCRGNMRSASNRG